MLHNMLISSRTRTGAIQQAWHMAPLPKLDKRKWKMESAKIQGSSKDWKGQDRSRTGVEKRWKVKKRQH